MEMVTLKNGSQEAKAIVSEGIKLLGYLNTLSLWTFHELVECMRKPRYKMLETSLKILKNLGIVDANGCVHDSMRNIILSATADDDLGMSLNDPIAQ